MPFLTSASLREGQSLPDEYPFDLPFLRNKNFELRFSNNVSFLVGENGSGKSTLLEALAIKCGFHPSGGSRNHLYNHHSTESALSDYLTLRWKNKVNNGFFFRSETFFNFASYLERLQAEVPGHDVFAPYGGKSLHHVSHGEAFLKLFSHRFNRGIFLLDEPESALSPKRQLSLLSILHELDQEGKSQFIIATHSPILLAYPDATLFELNQEGIQSKQYMETEHFRITKDFLHAPERYCLQLFKKIKEGS